MTKDPSFLFYTQDFLTGTYCMTDEQVGKYIRLLCLQHQTGHLDKEDMLNICKTYDKKVYSKFTQDKQGLYYNERLEIEADKRNNYCDSRRKNRTYEKHMLVHMEDEDERTTSKGEYEGENKINSDGYITPKLFDTFWKMYPKKTDKGKALTKWNYLCTKKDKRPVWREMRIAIRDQIKSERWQNSKFIPLPTTWLNQNRWLDDPKEMVSFEDRDKINNKPKYYDNIRYDYCEDGRWRSASGELYID